jgi:parvulin-like peptidyl-prolyl isomerase
MASTWKQIWDDLRDSLGLKIPKKRETTNGPESSEGLDPGINLKGVSKVAPDEIGKTPALASTDLPTGEDDDSSEPSDVADRRRVPGIGLVVAGVILIVLLGRGWWTNLTAPAPPAENVIATFDGAQITITDVEEHISQLVPEELSFISQSAETFISTIEHLVIEELVKRWATQRQPDADEDFRHTMQHINEDLNLQSFESQLHEGEISVSESEIQAYFNANRDLFGDQSLNEVREQIRQTLVFEREEGYVADYSQSLKDNASITRFFDLLEVPVPTEDELRRYYDNNRDQYILPRQVIVDELQFPYGEEEASARRDAEDALLKIRGGTPFDEVNQFIPRAVISQNLTISEGDADSDWEARVFELTEAELSNVFQSGNAFYIVRLLEIQPGGIQPFIDARPLIEASVSEQISEAWFEKNESRTLFTLKGRQYSLGQFYQEYKELPLGLQLQYAGVEGMKEMAETLIERLLLIEDTYDQLLNVENQDIATEARLQVLQQMLHQEEVDDKIEISDDEIQIFYDENINMMKEPPQMRIRYIRIGMGNSQDEITSARNRIHSAYARLVPGLFQKGEDFATIAREYSEDPESAAAGGELEGWVGESTDILAELELHPFHEAILDLPTGDISEPFEFDGSLYIVEVIERTAPVILSIDEVRPYIEEILNLQKHDQLLLELQGRLLEDANLVIYSKVVEDYLDQLSASATPFPSSD